MDASKVGMAASGLSPWCFSQLRRSLDVVYSIMLIFVSLPLMAIAAVLIEWTSPGPVLFRQERLGKNGIRFQLLKFRTMYDGRRIAGSGLTRCGDPRVTAVGRFLRRWKLDELPQLFNVLCGEMSLVGPRPDLPEYSQKLRDDQRLVLLLLPGITGAASLHFRNEEVLLDQVAPEQLESFYVSTLLPQKIELDLEYARKASFVSDMSIMFRTAAVCSPLRHGVA
jgi:lipopolysaccharide/colanic/teichoic acid biosynthesis glycosyltransferase